MPQSGRLGPFVLGFVSGVVAGLLLLAAWLGITGAIAARDALNLRDSADSIASAGRDGDYQSAAAAISAARAQAAGLDARLSSAPWSWMQGAPGIGPTVAAGAVLARGADQVLSEVDGWSQSLVVAGGAGDLSAAASALAAAGPNLSATAVAAQSAARDVAALDTDLVLPQVRDRVRLVQRQFLDVATPLSNGASVARVLPAMLGFGKPAQWLVVLGQPAEARGSAGGFYGAFTSLSVADGRFTMEQSRANGVETRDVQDLSALPGSYRRLWGSDATYLWGYNLTRHYPYSASVIQRAIDPAADYVVALDPRTVAGLLTLTGPVTVDGITIDAANAEEFFAHDIYVRYPDSAVKDRVMLAFVQQVFTTLSTAPLDASRLWSALGPAIGGGHLSVWSPDPAVEAALAPTPLGGVVPAEPGPWVTAAFNNTAGNKIDSYIASSLEYRVSGACAAAGGSGASVTGELSATLTLQQIPPGLPPYISGRNDEPNAPYGTSSMYVHLYAPIGAVGTSFEVDGKPAVVIAGSELDHPVWGVKVQLAPDRPVVVKATFTQPAYTGQPLTAVAQPMVQDTKVTVVDDRGCPAG